MVTAKNVATPAKKAVAKRAIPKPTDVSAPAAKVAAPKGKPAAKVTAESPKKAAVRKKPAGTSVAALSAAQRAHYVEVAAFYIAERRGFSGANPADDWVAAEAEIDRLISTGHFSGQAI